MNIDYKDTAWRLLQTLKECGSCTREALTGEDEYTKGKFSELRRAGLVRVNIDGLMVLAPSGSKRLRQINEAQAGPLQFAGKRLISTGTVTGTYTGAELRRTCLRAGAYDAFELPSLIGGQHHYRREIAA
jgi:hypothetical protein